MATQFAVNGDYVRHDGLSKDTPADGCMLGIWVYLTDSASRQYPISGDGASSDMEIQWNASIANDPFQCYAAYNTAALDVQVNAATFATYATNKWLLLILTWTVGGANSTAKLMMGDLVTPPAEPSSYVFQQAPSGTPPASNTFITFGNNGVLTQFELHGSIALAFKFDYAFTPTDLTRFWYLSKEGYYREAAMFPLCRVLSRYQGYTTMMEDYSPCGCVGRAVGTLATTVDPFPLKARDWMDVL